MLMSRTLSLPKPDAQTAVAVVVELLLRYTQQGGVVVYVKLEHAEFRLLRSAEEVGVGAEGGDVGGKHGPVGYVDLARLEVCEHGAEI